MWLLDIKGCEGRQQSEEIVELQWAEWQRCTA